MPPGPNCADGIKNGTETDVDCGGPCAPCTTGKLCGVGTDCASGICSAVVLWSDNTWKRTQTFSSNWWFASHNDSSWPLAVEQVPYGQPPWGYGAPMPSGTPAKWIWYFDSRYTNVPATVYFRRTFIAPNTSQLTLSITADDEFDLYVDGVFLGSGNWWYTTKTFTLNVAPFASTVIAVEAQNTGGGRTTQAGPAGLLVDVRGQQTYCRGPIGG